MKRNLILILYLFCTATALPLSSCHIGDSRPDLVKQKLTEKIAKESQGIFTLVSFSKTNGTEENALGGVQAYQMEFTCTINTAKDCWKNGDGIQGYFQNFFALTSFPTDSWTKSAWVNAQHYTIGSVFTLKGEAILIKKDNGWDVDSITMF